MRSGERVLGSVLALAGAASCSHDMADFDDIYSRGNQHLVMCAESIDEKFHLPLEQITDAMERAQTDGSTLHLYTHSPGVTVPVSTIEAVLAGAVARGIPFATYSELSGGVVPGSLALSFDDHGVDSWTAIRPLLASYHARVTFFVSGFLELSDAERAELRQLADDGHDIEYHSTHHLDAATYAADHGVDGYLADEIVPGLDAMQAAGYPIRVFAYPFGARNESLDDALAPYFTHLRAIRTTCPR
ncbi:MAG TPA: polysaccharide deacetylase family protein [Kofleriaceae bacterium]|nr:polysaccharide deacetylase family protein [Kofleriaceae bacterium]